MTNISEQDKNLLETLGLSNIPEQEKQAVLNQIDEAMSKRFLANILASLSPEKAKELSAEVEGIPSENTQEIITKIIQKHPDASKILEESAKQIVDEFKQNQIQSGSEVNAQAASPSPTASDNSPLSSPELTSEASQATLPSEPEKDAQEAVSEEPEKQNPPLVVEDLPANPFGDEIKVIKEDEDIPKTDTNASSESSGSSDPRLSTEPIAKAIDREPATEETSQNLESLRVAETPVAPEPPRDEQAATTQSVAEPLESQQPAAPASNDFQGNPFGSEISMVDDEAPKQESQPAPATEIPPEPLSSPSQEASAETASESPSSSLNPFVDQPPAPGEISTAQTSQAEQADAVLGMSSASDTFDQPQTVIQPNNKPDQTVDQNTSAQIAMPSENSVKPPMPTGIPTPPTSNPTPAPLTLDPPTQ